MNHISSIVIMVSVDLEPFILGHVSALIIKFRVFLAYNGIYTVFAKSWRMSEFY